MKTGVIKNIADDGFTTFIKVKLDKEYGGKTIDVEMGSEWGQGFLIGDVVGVYRYNGTTCLELYEVD